NAFPEGYKADHSPRAAGHRRLATSR
ncbi:hypothetical protein, partial [Streptomyces sp. NPDC005828]